MSSRTSRRRSRHVVRVLPVVAAASALVVAACGRDVLIGIATVDRNPAGSGGTSGGAWSSGGTGVVVTASGGTLGGSGGVWGGSGGIIGTGACPTISTTIGQLNACGRTPGVAYSPDGRFLATATEHVPNGAATPFLHIWRLSDGALVREPSPDSSLVYDSGALNVAFSPDGTIVATAGYPPRAAPFSNTVNLWDTATGALLRTLPTNCGQYAAGLGFSHDGTRLVTAGERGGIEIWSIPGGTRLLSIPFNNTVYTAHFSPDDTRLITASLMIGTVWNAQTGAKIFDIPGLEGEMNAAVFSPNGQTIVSTADEGKVKVLDAAGTLLQTLTFKPATLPYFSSAVWIDDARFVIDDWSGAVQEWAADGSGAFVQSHVWSENTQTMGMAVSPDRTTFVVGGDAGFVFLTP